MSNEGQTTKCICDNCGREYSVFVTYEGDGLSTTTGNEVFCPRCIDEEGGVSKCLRCDEEKVLGVDVEDFCEDCHSYIDSN